MPTNNVCNCPNPPGGQVVCEPHQMAVCIIQDGQARQQCLDPIKSSDSLTLVNWALSEITGNIRSIYSIVTSQDIELLTQKKHNIGSTAITFSLPQSIQKALEEITKERGNDRGLERGMMA
jgi:hypothetical protein